MIEKLVIGTTNKEKVSEFASVLTPLGIKLSTSSHKIKEDGNTIADNAKVKAIAYSNLPSNKGKIILSEDSGLVIPTMGDLPGVESSNLYQLTINDDFTYTIPSDDEHDWNRNEEVYRKNI